MSSTVLTPLSGLFSSAPAIVTPKAPTDTLRTEHFSADPASLRFPANLDFKSANFKLRTLESSALSQVRESAPREIDLTCNELTALTALNRFQQLRVVNAMGNSLSIGGGLILRLPRLQELDLSGNRLVSVPPLTELPQLQVLRLQRNQIASNWQELQRRATSLRELDVSRNRLQWQQTNGEFEAGMAVRAVMPSLPVTTSTSPSPSPSPLLHLSPRPCPNPSPSSSPTPHRSPRPGARQAEAAQRPPFRRQPRLRHSR